MPCDNIKYVTANMKHLVFEKEKGGGGRREEEEANTKKKSVHALSNLAKLKSEVGHEFHLQITFCQSLMC